jgi:hypothetical protein
MGAWLSWSERAVHIREVIGSSPIAPIVLHPQERHGSPADLISLVYSWGAPVGRQ